MLNPWPALWILLAGPLWGLPGPDRVPPRGPFSPAPPCCSAAAGREAAHPGTTLLKEKRIDGKLVREHTHLADGLVVGTYELGMFLSPARALAATCGLELPDPLGGAARGGRGRIKSASAALQRFRVSVAAASRQIGEDMWAFARCKVQRGCFPAGTPARTERGLVPVEEVRKGGKVHSWDPATGEWRLAEVEATMSREYHGDIITVTVTNEDGEAEGTFRATANHPVFVAEGRNLRLRPQPAEVPASEPASEAGRWVSAGDLRIGDTLLTERHSLVPITELTRERRRIPVYNLHVRGTHTYAVGQAGTLVHNNCGQNTIVRRQGRVKELSKATTGERAFAKEFFADKGVDVILAGKGKAGADILVEGGLRWELKQLTISNPSKVATRIKEALQQGPNAVIDLRNSPLSNVQSIMGYKEAVRKGWIQAGQQVRIISRSGLDYTF